MLVQHLLARCKQGAFDTAAATNGFKTAAVSETGIQFRESVSIRNLCSLLELRGSLPDNLPLPGIAGKPGYRGLLRISHSGEASIVSRSFRVADLCDNRGTVTFTHSYYLTGEERERFLNAPWVALRRESFDIYEEANRRTGGLSSGRPVPLDQNLDLFAVPQTPVSSDIFAYSGFDEDMFAAFLSALNDRIAGRGKVALATEQITQSLWDTEGGSTLGELLLAALYDFLPDCITRKMGSISYWNDLPDYQGLQGIHLLLVPDGQAAGLNREQVSLIDLKEHSIRNVRENLIFGRFLWRNRKNRAALQEFYDFLSRLLDSGGAAIPGTSDMMDLAVKLYSYEKTGKKQENLLPDMLSLFLPYLYAAPEIERYCMCFLEEASVEENGELLALADRVLSAEKPCSQALQLSLLSYIIRVVDHTGSEAGGTLLKRLLEEKHPFVQEAAGTYLAEKPAEGRKGLVLLLSRRSCCLLLASDTQENLVRRWREAFEICLAQNDFSMCLALGQGVWWRLEEDLGLQEAGYLHESLFRLCFSGRQDISAVAVQELQAEILRIMRRYPERGEAFRQRFYAHIFQNSEPVPNGLIRLIICLLPLAATEPQREQWMEAFNRANIPGGEDPFLVCTRLMEEGIPVDPAWLRFVLCRGSLGNPATEISAEEILAALENTDAVRMEEQVSILRLLSERQSEPVQRRAFLESLSRTKFFFLYYYDCLSQKRDTEELDAVLRKRLVSPGDRNTGIR